MSKLKIVKERKRNGGDNENDLRGLGHDPVLDKLVPRSILFVEQVTESTINETSALFKLKAEHLPSLSGYLLSVTRPLEGEHKLQALTMLGAALFIHNKNKNAKLTINEITDLPSEVISFNDAAFSLKNHIFGWDHNLGALAIGIQTQHHLAQAGFNIEPLTHHQIFGAQNLLEFRNAFSTAKDSSSKNKKVG